MLHLPDLKSWLKLHTSDDDELRLRRPVVAALFDELQTLRQSADRLRKQNRKVRAKVARLKGGDAATTEPPDDEKDEDDAPGEQPAER